MNFFTEKLVIESMKLYSNDISYIAIYPAVLKLEGARGSTIERQVVVKSFLVDTVEDVDTRKELERGFKRESRFNERRIREFVVSFTSLGAYKSHRYLQEAFENKTQGKERNWSKYYVY